MALRVGGTPRARGQHEAGTPAGTRLAESGAATRRKGVEREREERERRRKGEEKRERR